MLHQKLDLIITELKEANIILEHHLDLHGYDEFVNQKDALITLHDIGNYRPVHINNACKAFYGFTNNFLSGMDYIYYLKTIHRSYYPTLFRSLSFFNEDNEEHLNLTYKLKNAAGKWQIMLGTTKTITRTTANKPHHAITLMIPENDQLSVNPEAPIRLLESLTKREREIFLKIAEGLAPQEIGSGLFISEETVKKHKQNIFKKLKLNKTSELVKLAFELGVKY
ncbi:response regulator transcription factor [Echinicola soli]|uniref:Response regulator transcription factor n=1 Tax=Echinicola soli TaxID=2591634 RepID=A0A514CDR1_9BACT|nr:LuxR C-terminal-related transcriptional regulator [Echinicola soli]QDH77961.1 response regulator transcription factor [Echinicola soli]